MILRAKTAFAFFVILFAVFAGTSEASEVKCPSEFDPDDSAWVLISIERPAGNLATAERKFLYQPNPAWRLRRRPQFVDNCWGRVISYQLPGYKNSDVPKEKRVRMQFHAPAGDVFYLITKEGKLLKGTQIKETGDYSRTKSSTIRLILYSGSKAVGERIIPVPAKEKEFKLELRIPIN